MKHTTRTLTAAFGLLVLSGCGQNVTTSPPAATQSRSTPAAQTRPASTGESMLHFHAPPMWKEEPPSNSFRKAQYRLEGPGGDAEVVVFYFGQGQGGDIEANMQRWQAMFSDTNNSGRIEKLQGPVGPRTVLDIRGTFSAPPMAGGGPPRPGMRMRAAVLETDWGNWFVRLLGPDETVEHWKQGFDDFLETAHMEEL